MIAVTASDYHRIARRRLPRLLFDYVEGGSYAEITVNENVRAFEMLRLRQRVLRDTTTVETGSTLFGKPLTMPAILGPIGLAGMYARRGEVQAARAAEAFGIPFTLSTVSICPIEEVRRALKAPPWMQLYMTRDRGFMRDLLARAANEGCETLVLTVDLPTPGARYRDMRSGMYGGLSLTGEIGKILDAARHPRWLWDVWLRGRPHVFGNVAAAMPDARTLADFWAWLRASFDLGVTWRDIAWLRAHWRGPILVKGIMEVDDAREATASGVDGIIVSNHGGRQLDGIAPTIEKLPAIADAVGDQTVLLIDSGIRTGLDIFKALAAGARACLLGRPWIYALAAGGEAAVGALLATMQAELRTAMILTGATTIAGIDGTMLDRNHRTTQLNN